MKEESQNDFEKSLNKIRTFFSYLFEKYDFQIFEKNYHEEHFGNFVFTLKGDFYIRFVSDRGQIFIDVKPLYEKGGWFDLRNILEFLKRDERVSYTDSNLEELGNHLRANYEGVKKLFEEEQIYSVLRNTLKQF